MDHAANEVLHPIVIQNANGPLYKLIDYVCQAKGRSTARGCMQDKPTPTIIDRGLPVQGLFHILTYLDDQYPDPPLCFDTPERRAIVRMTTDQIVHDLYAKEFTTDHPTLLALSTALLQSNSGFIMDRFSLIDLVVAALDLPYKIWQRHHQRVKKVLIE